MHPDSRPHKEVVTAAGKTVAALYDTGSAITAISARFFEHMRHTATRMAEVDALINITTVDGNPLPTEGCYAATVWFDGRWRAGAFFVMEGLTSDVLLGIDFIRNQDLNYKARTNQVIAQDNTGQIKTRKETRIPAGSRQLVKVSCIDLERDKEELVIASIGSQAVPVAGAETIVDGVGQHFEVYIDNIMDVELVIPRGTVVGALEAVPEASCRKLDLKDDERPKELPPPRTKCDKEKEEMLREVIGEQMKALGPEIGAKYLEVILENHDVFSKDKSDLGRTSVMEHKIDLRDKEPSYNKQFRIPEEHRSILIEHLHAWLKLGVVSPCRSHWNSPIFLVPKKDGTMRPVLDFREVNKKTIVDKYSAREVSDCIDEIGRCGSKIFSSLDLTAGFWQLPLEEESRPYTAFTIPGMGSFAWNCTPMGLLGSPATFGRMMEFIMRFLLVIAYQDDLLVHAKTHAEQLETLKKCFARLRANGLKLNAKKCAFGQPEIPYLGYTLTPEGVLPGKDKTKAIRDSRPPRTLRQVREFTGLCNYFRASIKGFAQLAAPLNRLLTKEAGWKGGELPEEAAAAYQALKDALTEAPVLAYPNPKLDYHLVVDASLGLQGAPGGLGASLMQIDEKGVPHAVGFASRGLSRFEKNYTSYLAELTACVFGIEYFQVYLKGRHFYLYTDHRPMERLSATHTRTLNRLQQLMGEYHFTIQYKPGKDNEVADFLSRNPIASIDMAGKDLKELQDQDELIQRILETWEDERAPEALQRLKKNLVRDRGLLFFKKPDGGRAIFAPKVIQGEILRAAHNSLLGGHMGVFKSRERILGRYFWPNIQADVEQHVRECLECQRVKPWNRPKKAPLKPLQQPERPNHRIHIDLFGPLATSGKGKKMICVITDAFTKYTELVALRSKEAGEVARAIMDTWITRYSTPEEIVTDGGKEFANKLMGAICQELRILHRQTTPYHPETNASAEVFNRTMKLYLASALEQPYLDWEELLPALRICYNTSVSKATKATPFSLVFAMQPNMPFFDLEQALTMDENYPEMVANLKAMREKAKENNLRYRAEYKKEHDKAKQAVKQIIKPGDFILVENTHRVGANPKFHNAFLGPFEVTRVEDLNIFYLKDKKERVAHMNRVKPARLPTTKKDETRQECGSGEKSPDQQGQQSARTRKVGQQDGGKKCNVSSQTPGQQAQGMRGLSREQGQLSQQVGADGRVSDKTPSQQARGMCEHSTNPGQQSQHDRRGTPEQQSSGKCQPSKGSQVDGQQIPGPEKERDEVTSESGEHEESTLLPNSPFPPTPAFYRYRQAEESGSEDSEGVPQGESLSWDEESERGDAEEAETRTHDGMEMDERSHIFHNEVEMVEPRKRKPSSPLAQERKRAAVDLPPARNLRSRGLPQVDQSLPDRPKEYRAYTRKPCTSGEQSQSSET